MVEITLTIDGKEVKGESEDTILKVCQKNGIHVPTLCHYEGLSDIGSCRMCIVEVEAAGRLSIETACTKPAADGMIVRVNTERLKEMRKATCELIFVEGNHFCMYCVASGNCELQDLAYELGISYIRWPNTHPRRDIDSSHQYLVMDHDRCIMCYRCIRACEELVGNGTLGIDGRGFRAKIIADHKVPWGKSSCVSAGSCLQVCPTGAISDHRNAYMGRRGKVQRIKSTCLFCSVGCGIELVTRDNHLLRIDGNWDAKPNEGLLCALGRFEPLFDGKRARAIKPLMRRNGILEETNWDDSLNLLAGKLNGFDKKTVGALISTRATNETMKLFSDFFRGMGVENLGCLEGPISDPIEKELNIADLDNADMFIVVGEDLVKDHQVAGFFVKRGVSKRWSFLLVIDEEETGLVPLANRWFKPSEVSKAVRFCDAAVNPVVIYGNRAGEEMSVLRRELSGKAKFFWMPTGVNSRGALANGLGKAFDAQTAKFVYVLAGDAGNISEKTMDQLTNADFVTIQSSYIEPWAKVADFILPTVTWVEKEGSITNLEGKVLNVTKAIEPPSGIKAEAEVLNTLIDRLK